MSVVSYNAHWSRRALRFAALAALTGCGGGGDDDVPAVPADVHYQLAAGLLDADDRLDLAVIVQRRDDVTRPVGPSELRILLQDAARPGRFTVAQRLDVASREGALVATDLDGDGATDLALTQPTLDVVRVFLQDPAAPGRFLSRPAIEAGPGPASLDPADVDQDGAPDLVVGTDLGVVALRQDGSARGTFPASLQIVLDDALDADQALAVEHDSLATGDLDADDLPDVAVVRIDPDARLYRHEGAVPGTFRPAVTLSLDLEFPDAIAVDDVDGDDLDDIVAVGTEGSVFPQPIIRVRRQDPLNPGTFLPIYGIDLADEGSPRRIASIDVDDDGLADVVVAKLYVVDHGRIEVLRQQGPPFALRRLGIFAPLTLAGLDPHLRGMAVADLNGDDLPDIAVTDGELSVLFNDPANPGAFLPATRVVD